MSALPFPQDDHSAWSYVVINGAYFVCGNDFPEAKKGRKLDSKSAPGSDGGRIVDKGYTLSKVSITLKLWTREHFATWNAVASELQPRPGRQRSVVQVVHPALAALDIENVAIADIDSPKHPGKGLFIIKIEALEYHPSTRANHAPPTTTATRQPPAIVETNAAGGLTDNSLGVANPATPVSPRTTNARP